MNKYQNIKIAKGEKGRYYLHGMYPEIPMHEDDIYVITTQGDRYDLLAQQYYKDVSLWWVISLANYELAFDSICIPPGTQLRIPSQLQSIILEYNRINNL